MIASALSLDIRYYTNNTFHLKMCWKLRDDLLRSGVRQAAEDAIHVLPIVVLVSRQVWKLRTVVHADRRGTTKV